MTLYRVRTFIYEYTGNGNGTVTPSQHASAFEFSMIQLMSFFWEVFVFKCNALSVIKCFIYLLDSVLFSQHHKSDVVPLCFWGG